MTTVRRYYGVVHVRWELPFLLRLRSDAFLCWEPQEGAAAFQSLARVGAIQWSRSTPLLTTEDAFGKDFRPQAEVDEALPAHDYKQYAGIGGRQYLTTTLTPGLDGGFQEVQAYSIANMWLCLRRREDFAGDAVMSRATAALNNVLGVHAFMAADGNSRLLRRELDSYYTLLSLAVIPGDWAQMTASDLLHRLGQLSFQNDLGVGRLHDVGLGSPDDLTMLPFPTETIEQISGLIQSEVVLDVHQQLMLSAIRRLKRREYFLAIIDAESAVEVCVGTLLRRLMRARGSTDQEIDIAFDGRFSRPQQQIVQLDRLAVATNPSTERFENSETWQRWNRELAKVRHDVVHRGLRQVSRDAAVDGISAGMKATIYLEQMVPQVAPGLRWGPDYALLQSITDHGGKLFRLFDA